MLKRGARRGATAKRGRAFAAWADAYAGRRVLVTGASGFLGSALVAALSGAECRITRLLRRRADIPAPRDRARIVDIIGDIRQRSTWKRALAGIDLVFHLAGQTSERAASADPAADFDANVLPMLHLVRACRRRAPPAVIFAGTATECGVTGRAPVNEDHADNPASVYDLHKLIAEILLAEHVRSGCLHGTTLRFSNIYGPSAAPSAQAAERGVLVAMMRRALRGEPLPLYAGGERLRDYLYLDDAVRALVLAGLHAESLQRQQYIVGSGIGCGLRSSFELVADRAALRTGRRVAVTTVPTPRQNARIGSRSFVADSRRFRRATGWRPRISLREGIDLTLDMLR